MKKTGQLLKDAREAKGISLQEVSIHLKISTRTLKALEDGDKAQLPAKTFLRGFVQSYAQFLKINLHEVMVIFQDEMGTTHPGMITTQIATPPTNYVNPPTSATPPTVAATLPPSTSAPLTEDSVNVPVEPKISEFPTTSTDVARRKSSKNKKNKKQDPMDLMQRKSDSTTSESSSSSIASTTSGTQPGTSSVKTAEPVAPALSVDPKTWSHSLKIGTVLLIVFIISIIVAIKRTIDKYEREAMLPVGQLTVETVEKKTPLPEASPLAVAQSEEGVTPIASPTTEVSNSAISLTTKPLSSASDGVNSKEGVVEGNILPLASPAVSAGTALNNPAGANNVTSIKSPTPQIEAQKPAEDIKTQEVIVEALDRVTIEYSIDGGGKESLILQAEKIHTFKAKKNMNLNVSDGGSINLIYNGKDKGVPGNLGQAYTVSFPQ